MRAPQVSHTVFHLLSGLMDGREKTGMEIRQQIGWETPVSSFVQTMRRMHCRGLVRKSDVLRREGQTLQRRRVIQITDEGRQVWQECLDFYLFCAEHFAGEREPEDTARIVHRSEVAPSFEVERRLHQQTACYTMEVRRIAKRIWKSRQGKQEAAERRAAEPGRDALPQTEDRR